MADIALVAAKVAPVFPANAEIYSGVCGVAITTGQVVYQAATGLLAIADGSAAGTALLFGIALEGGGIGQAVSVLKRGHVAGFTVSGSAPHAILYISDTAGALADAAGTVSVAVGVVLALSDSDETEVLYVGT